MKDIFKKINFNERVTALIGALISGSACVIFFDFATSNIFALVFLFLFYWLFKEGFKIKEKNIKICSNILGFLFMASLLLANLSKILSFTPRIYGIFCMLLYIFGFYLLFKNLTAVLYQKLLKYSFLTKNHEYTKKRAIILYFVSMIIMLLCWIPYFLKDFPGIVTADSNNQLMQCLGNSPLCNHHPIAHTFTIKVFFELGMLLFGGNQTMAIATFSVCQAILLSAAFSFLIVTLYKFNFKKIFMVTVLAFYAIIPYNGAYSVTMWKDIWFGGIVLVLSTTVWRLIEYFKDGKKKLPVFEFVLFVIFAIAMCLFRSNGWYAYIVFAPCVFFVFRKKNLCIALAALIILPVVFIVKGPIYNSIGVTQPDTIESLSIPAQHIARAITDGAELTDEQYDLLSEVVVVEEIPNRYKSYISDPIKNLVRESENQEFLEKNKGEFLKLWIDLGLKNPRSYILAQIDQTYGYWYPDVQYWVFSTQLFDKGLECEKVPIFSEANYERFMIYMHSYEKIPYYGLLWSIGTFTWVFAFMIGLCFIKRKKSYLLVYVPLFAILATLMIATPVYSEFRYIYSLFTTMPVFMAIPFAVKCEKKIALENAIDLTEQ